MPELVISEIATEADREAGFAIRREVFCVEQGVSVDEEFDGLDGDCQLYLARLGGGAIATARLRHAGAGEVKIERVAVIGSQRGNGYGKAMMARLMQDAAASDAGNIVIHAQCHAEEFYRALGFTAEGGVFEEAGIDHVRMVLGEKQ